MLYAASTLCKTAARHVEFVAANIARVELRGLSAVSAFRYLAFLTFVQRMAAWTTMHVASAALGSTADADV